MVCFMNIIEVVNLISRYKIFSEEKDKTEEKTVIDDISLSIGRGDFVGILGHNGSGKSTLARHLTALLRPAGGFVYVKGMDTASEKDILDIRKSAGIVFQNPDNQIIGSTVEEDVAFGLENLGVPREKMWGRIAGALEATGMTAFRYSVPGQLSGGQKQRVAISGILAMEPECIVFDEPTAMLDPKGCREVREAVRYLNQEKKITIIYITHHIDEVKDADYLYVMNRGKLALKGSPEDLWAREEELEENGVELPFIQSLAEKLKRYGLKIPRGISEEDELVEYLAGILCHIGQEKGRWQTNVDRQTEENRQTGLDRTVSSHQGMRLLNVSYSYDSIHQADRSFALKEICLDIHPGEYIALAGQTGSGKSTLLMHLNGLLKPTEGRYVFEGRDVSEKNFSMSSLRQKAALCFQYPENQLFEESVLKDICFGPANMGLDKEACLERARNAMKLTGLSPDLENRSPFLLSGGQKRRVALAGILAMEPDYLILDEPAAGLDKEGREMLYDLLEALNRDKGITIIMVSHNMNDLAARARRIILMKDGAIAADGKPADIFMDRQLLEDTGLDQPDCVRLFIKLRKRLTAELSGRNDPSGQGDLPGLGEKNTFPPAVPLTQDQLAEWIRMMCRGEEVCSGI